MRLKQFLVLPKLPDRIAVLQDLAQNLWYSWNWELVKLFIRLDAEMWERCNQNPVQMLSSLPQETLLRAAEDDGFVASLHRVRQRLQDYLDTKKWFSRKYPDLKDETIAYFSLEYGLDTGLPVYSGGLGVLSGDTLKSATDTGIPLVGIGLLYRYGYFRQILSSDGWQQERYEENDWYQMPVQMVKGPDDQQLRVTVDIDHTPVQVAIWKVMVGAVPLYLLDTNIPENAGKHREITSVLYGGDKDMRIRQEIVLGVGGVRALHALGLRPSIYHINEGHAWFLSIERMRHLIQDEKLSYAEASQYVWATSVFTTHTPVPAGNERFDPVLVHRYLHDQVAQLGLSWRDFLALGRVLPDDESEGFIMTVAALRNSAFCNGVSKLHGRVSRDMWHNIWPNLPREEVPIKAITNGVHPPSWISHNMKELYESYFGPGYVEDPSSLDVWKQIYKIPDSELWRVHNRRRERLVFFARKRLKEQLRRRGASQVDMKRADQVLDPQVLTVGFARRFSTYKRGNLLFFDTDRLARIVNNPDYPVQIILSGKAHPLDKPGKEIIKQVVSFASEDRFRDRIIFLEDYDINVARYLVQGVDVWLNNPRRPQEASGTSGMKAALNGGLHMSVLDGWWDEGYSPETGFKIGNGEDYDNVELGDRMEAEMLYDALEREVVPTFYERDPGNVPVRWVTKMKASIHMAGEKFSAHRMLMDYTQEFYRPAILAARRLRADGYDKIKKVTAWTDRMAASWDKVEIRDVHVPEKSSTLHVGQELAITVQVYLGEIQPEDIRVEVVSGRLNAQEQILGYSPIVADLSQKPNDGVYTFSGTVTCLESGRFGITARIVPKNDDLPHTIKPRWISWW
jgi:starch phosphorylase